MGRTYAGSVYDVFAIGNVTGRGSVGGLVGFLDCTDGDPWLLYKGIYRGDVVDRNAPSGGWAGTVGDYNDCTARWAHCLWDSTLDASTNWHVMPGMQNGATTAQLRSNTNPMGRRLRRAVRQRLRRPPLERRHEQPTSHASEHAGSERAPSLTRGSGNAGPSESPAGALIASAAFRRGLGFHRPGKTHPKSFSARFFQQGNAVQSELG